MLSDRALQKIRAGERGWRYAVEQLVAAGALEPSRLRGGEADPEELRAWLPGAFARATRTMRHPGNHRYVWGLERSISRSLVGMPYPKAAVHQGGVGC